MRKLKIGILFLGLALLFVLAGTVNAATEPELKNFNSKEYFFANGKPITIEERTDGQAGAKITWTSGEQNVGPNANVFGGMHDDATEVNTSITMNGGTVRNIIGGGLHLSNTNTSKIEINGGNVVGVNGGGASSLTHDCGCSNATTWYSGDAKNSPCQTRKVEVIVNEGKISSQLYGGGEGISNTQNSCVTINGGDLSSTYVTAGGSNGNTTNAMLNIYGGNLNIVQSVNRGTIENVNVAVTGGKIKELYVGGETRDNSVNGKMTGNVSFWIAGDAKITTMELGKNDNRVIDLTTGNVKAENIIIMSGRVENATDLAGKILQYCQVKIEEETYLLTEGKTIKDLDSYEQIIKKEGYVFKGFKKDGKDFDVNTPITSNIELTRVFEKITTIKPIDDEPTEDEPIEDGSKEEEKDETPKTGSIDVALVVSAMLTVSTLAGIVVVKKYNK